MGHISESSIKLRGIKGEIYQHLYKINERLHNVRRNVLQLVWKKRSGRKCCENWDETQREPSSTEHQETTDKQRPAAVEGRSQGKEQVAQRTQATWSPCQRRRNDRTCLALRLPSLTSPSCLTPCTHLTPRQLITDVSLPGWARGPWDKKKTPDFLTQ